MWKDDDKTFQRFAELNVARCKVFFEWYHCKHGSYVGLIVCVCLCKYDGDDSNDPCCR